MKVLRRPWWLIYAACSVVALSGLAWLTVTLLDLERSERAARAEAQHQEALRLGLWRMDSWFGPVLAREGARPVFEYLSYYPQERAYTRILNEIEAGEVLSPSPLLTLRSPFIRLHFQIDEEGTWSSPQVPTGNQLDLAEATLVSADRIAAGARVLQDLREATSFEDLRAGLENAESALTALLAAEETALAEIAFARNDEPEFAQLRNQQELTQRARRNAESQVAFDLDPPTANGTTASMLRGASPGPLVPTWLDGELPGGAPRLVFVRLVHVRGRELLQGFLCDWNRVREELLEQVRGLFPSSRLGPHRGPAPDPEADGRLLAAIPARLETTWPELAHGPVATPARAGLAVSWIATLLALVAVGVTLRASIDLGEKRSRFASTVTHELRSPLTTFRMYSEMLAKGMVPDERRTSYLETLQRESHRLSILVENVLAYARLEEGRAGLRRDRLSAREVLERVVPELERHAEAAGTSLHVDAEEAGEELVRVDADAVEQILFNLVDNAGKYGRSDDEAAIELGARVDDGFLELRIRDRGPGIPSSAARAIFRPFERGDRDPADPNPGVGLGLALARGLARDLGGDLVLESPPDGGACFCLRIPRAT